MNDEISGFLDEARGHFSITTKDGGRASLDLETMEINFDGGEAMLRSSTRKYEPTDIMKPWFRLTRIIVDPKHRRRGLGKRLLAFAVSAADTHGIHIACEVGPYARTIPVRPLVRLFKANGFFTVPRSRRLMIRLPALNPS